MVILQFNKLIRNKWVWGVFAVAVSAAFCFDDLFRSNDPNVKQSSSLENLSVGYDKKLEDAARMLLAVFPGGLSSTGQRSHAEVDVAKVYAALAAFNEAGIRVSDKSLAQSIRSGFLAHVENDEAKYRDWIKRSYNLDLRQFEELVRQNSQLLQGIDAYFSATAWVSPMELDQLCHDATDRFSVRVATFEQTKEEADAIKVDEEGLKTWFAENTARLQLPQRLRFRSVEFSAANTNLTAQIKVTDEEITTRYEADKDSLYTTTDTNGVATVKAVDEVKDEISRKLLNEKFMAEYGDMLSQQTAEENNAIDDDPDADHPSLVEKIAKENGLQSKVSGWIAIKPSSDLIPGFAQSPSAVFPGAAGTEVLAYLDSESANYYRYAVLTAESSHRIWLVESIECSPAHDATFEECKGLIEAPALKDAKKKAFKEAVKLVTEKGVDAVLASGKVSDVVTFSRSDEKRPEIENAYQVMSAAVQLNKGEMSDLIETSAGKGIVVVCTERTDADSVAALYDGERQALAQTLSTREFALPFASNNGQFDYFQYRMQMKYAAKREQWLKANLKALGYQKSVDDDASAAL